jgi:hypothetical protein
MDKEVLVYVDLQGATLEYGLRQACPSSFPQNLSFELREYSQQAGHRSTSWRGRIQSLGQRNERARCAGAVSNAATAVFRKLSRA